MQHQNKEVLFLSLEDVVDAGGADMSRAIEDVAHGFQLYTAGQVTQPSKIALSSEGTQTNGFNMLPAIVESDDLEVFGVKVLGANLENRYQNLPRALGLIALFDNDSKMPLALMDCQVISAMRTGAVSGLAARLLVPEVTTDVGLVGAGVNMRAQLLGIQETMPNLENVHVYATNGSKHLFAKEMTPRTGLNITAGESTEDIIRNNAFNILCTTKPNTPLFETSDLQTEGVTVFNISGVATPPEALKSMDRLVTDSWIDCKNRSSQTLPRAVEQNIINSESIEELGDLLAANTQRTNDKENIFFCPVGLAFEDTLVAWRVYRTAIEKSIGEKVRLWSDTKWI